MRNRNMYYMTGLPGWMRFGYSPGWVGRSASGLGPCAEYLMSGQWPTPEMQMAAQGYPMGQTGMPMGYADPYGMGYGSPMGQDPEAMRVQQLAMLQQQVQFLQQQLEQINAQIAQLEQPAE